MPVCVWAPRKSTSDSRQSLTAPKVVVVQSPSGQYPIELDVIELPSPKPGRAYATGWEHIEIAICEDTDPASALVSPVEDLSAASMRVLEAFLAHPLNAGVPFDTTALGKGGFNLEVRFRAGDAGSIKFHWLPLETVVEIEKKELH
ncbi:hypothetical protein BC830DRAFT_1224114 [Chytriomyces sp. MP71]|nr:hypothetical protein BC830DRAFT_1224114 [Chytriomyces sp. MP71]